MNKFILTIALAISFLVLVPNQYGETKRLTDQERQVVIDTLVEQWQKLYGNVNFRDMWLFAQMTYIEPRFREEYKKRSLSTLPRQSILHHEIYAEEIFLGELTKGMLAQKEAMVYLGKDSHNEDLLKFQFELAEFDVTVLEGSSAYLIELRLKDKKPVDTINSQQIIQFLRSNVKLSEQGSLAVATLFLEGSALTEGTVYSTGKDKDPQMVSDWNDLITVFMSKDSVNVILFKAQPGRAMLGLPHEPKWLSGPQKTNESSK